MKEELISRDELRRLPNYSCTLPTGPRVGFRWRRDLHEPKRFAANHEKPLCLTDEQLDRWEAFKQKWKDIEPEWVIGEATHSDEPGMVGIVWSWAVECPGKVHRGDLR